MSIYPDRCGSHYLYKTEPCLLWKGGDLLGAGGGCSWLKKDVYWIKDSSGQKQEHGDGGGGYRKESRRKRVRGKGKRRRGNGRKGKGEQEKEKEKRKGKEKKG